MSAAILEVLALLHMERDVVHLAAIEQQSQKAQSYVADFFSRPIINRFVTKQNERRVEITKYVNKITGEIIPLPEWEKLPPVIQDSYNREINYIQIIVATMKSANSEHAAFMVLDEFDLMDSEKVIEEAKMIPGIDRKGHYPITLITSSRKSTYGFVQKEIDNSHKTGTKILHWNVLEITQKCPPERHLPEEPKVAIYVNEDLLEALSEIEFQDLPIEQKDKYIKQEGFKGCLNNCKLFPLCKGSLATKQTSKVSSLKPIDFMISRFKEVETQTAIAQLCCWRPMTSGLIFPRFDRNTHVLTLDKIFYRIFDENPPQNMTKKMFLTYFKLKGFQFHSGVDFGYTHAFSVVTAFVHNNVCYVIDTISEKELEIMEKIEVLNDRIKYLSPILYPDPESPSDIKTLQKHGYKCKSFEKDVLGGINAVRSKLKPSLGMPPQLFFLGNDRGNDVLIKSMTQYHWKTDPTGNWTDRPAPDGADECFTDETEYLTKNGWISLSNATTDTEALIVDEHGNARWEKPLGIVKKFYEGKMYKINNKDLEFTTTENHEHAFIKFTSFLDKQFNLEKHKLSELDKKAFILKSPISTKSELETIGPLWGYFAGCYLANNYINKSKSNFIEIKLNRFNEKTIENVCEKLELKFKPDENGLFQLTYFIPKIKEINCLSIWDLSERECMSILQGLYDSLSFKRLDVKIVINDPNKDSHELLELIQALHIKVGGSGILTNNSFEPSHSGFAMIVPNDITEDLDYSGMVYCITTSTGFFLARTNGKVFVTGNCDALRYLITNLFGFNGKVLVANKDVNLGNLDELQKDQYTQENWLHKKINELTGENNAQDGVVINKPGFKFII
jgi:hypothetical protein